jgi:hypothetical protein
MPHTSVWLILRLVHYTFSLPWKLSQLLLIRRGGILDVSTIKHALSTLSVGAVAATTFIRDVSATCEWEIQLVLWDRFQRRWFIVFHVIAIILHDGQPILVLLTKALGCAVVRRHWWAGNWRWDLRCRVGMKDIRMLRFEMLVNP